MAKNKNTASVLAFEKKMVPSDGYMYGTTWEDRDNLVPLKLKEKSVRGTISNRLKPAIQNDPAKLNKEVEKANLHTVDTCALEPDQDTLMLRFTLKFLGGIHRPSACNNAVFRQSYTKAAQPNVKKPGSRSYHVAMPSILPMTVFSGGTGSGQNPLTLKSKHCTKAPSSNGNLMPVLMPFVIWRFLIMKLTA